MDPSDISALLDALTGGTAAERFGEVLAAAPTPHIPPPLGPAFEMPLVAAHHLPPPDPLSPAANFLSSHLDLAPPSPADYAHPVSAVTGASSSRSDATRPPIRKKRLRASPAPVKPKREAVLAVAAAAAAAVPLSSCNRSSAASDVSSRPLPDPPSRSPQSRTATNRPVKLEPVPLRRGAAAPRTPAAQRSAAAQASPSLPKSHTRKCREKVTRQFHNLLEVLPRPPKGVEVKHKAQILEYTISIFRYLLLRRTALQTEIALASKPALCRWMDATITAAASALPCDADRPQKAVPLSAVLEPFVGLYCVKKSWTYGEMWLVDPETGETSLASCVFNTDDDDVLQRFDSFATVSRSRFSTPAVLKSGIISRVLASRRPEWLADLSSDPRVFDRADLAAEHGMRVAEAVPVMLDATRCAAVLLFADVAPHDFSTADMTTLLDYTSVLGGLYMQYVNGFQTQAAGHRPADDGIDVKLVIAGRLAGRAPDRTSSAGSSEPSLLHRNQEVYGMANAQALLPPSSETSYFGEADFVGGH